MRISDWSSDVCSSDVPADDANFASVLFLLGADGTPGSTRFIDDSSYHRINDLNGAGNIISTAKFGVFEEEALRLPGTSLMQYLDSNDWAFGDRKSTRLNSSH